MNYMNLSKLVGRYQNGKIEYFIAWNYKKYISIYFMTLCIQIKNNEHPDD